MYSKLQILLHSFRLLYQISRYIRMLCSMCHRRYCQILQYIGYQRKNNKLDFEINNVNLEIVYVLEL